MAYQTHLGNLQMGNWEPNVVGDRLDSHVLELTVWGRTLLSTNGSYHLLPKIVVSKKLKKEERLHKLSGLSGLQPNYLLNGSFLKKGRRSVFLNIMLEVFQC